MTDDRNQHRPPPDQPNSGARRPAKGRPSGQAKRSFVGSVQRVDDAAQAYLALSQDDEQAAKSLQAAARYRQAVYFYIQAMEKLARSAILAEAAPRQRDDSGLSVAERLRTHNLDELLAMLLEIYQKVIGDDRISAQIQQQMADFVLGGVHFGHLHNDVRYLRFMDQTDCHLLLLLTNKDADAVSQKLNRLRSFIDGFQRIKQATPPADNTPQRVESTPPRNEPQRPSPLSEFKF